MNTFPNPVIPVLAREPVSKLQPLSPVLQLSPALWARFDTTDRDLLAHLLNMPIKYYDVALFHEPEAETVLFGSQALIIEGRTHFPGLVLSGHAKERLSSLDEILLFHQFNYCRMRQQQIRASFGARAPLAALRLLLAWIHRAMDIRNQIVESNMSLVLAMFKRARFFNVDSSEMISEGSLALLRCVSEFDCSRGFKFSTYACRAIIKSFARVGIKASRYKARFSLEFNPEMESSEYEDLRRDDVRATCAETIREIVRDNRAGLSEAEQMVIHSRFLLNQPPTGLPAPTLEQLGTQIGVCKERVRQIQMAALRKLREALESSFLRNPLMPGDLAL